MSNKQQLRDINNPRLKEIKAAAESLPTQESMKHGLYVWSKWLPIAKTETVTVTNPYVNLTTGNGNTTGDKVLDIGYTNILHLASVDDLFFDGMKNETSPSAYWLEVVDGQLYLMSKSTNNTLVKYPIEYQPEKKRFYSHGNMISFTNSKFVYTDEKSYTHNYTEKKFIEYIVSDDASAYPEEGEQEMQNLLF